MKHLQVTSLSSYQIRRGTFDGRSHIIAPAILLTEGVHNGSGGAIYYPAEELSKFPAAWNGIPIPVLHPLDDDGTPISCNSPEVIDKTTIGRLFNVVYTDSKLKGELWIDEVKCKAIAPEVMAHLMAGRVMEVSTGLFSDDDAVEGVWNGEHYDSIARNMRPDHLALLPGQVGACSVADGCGVRANICKEGGYVDITSLSSSDTISVTTSDPTTSTLVLSDNNNSVLNATAPSKDVKEVDEEEEDDEDDEDKMHMMSKSKTKEKEVVTMSDVQKCCPKKVQTLIDDKATPFTINDREWLENLTPETFEKLSAVNYTPKAPETEEEVLANAPEGIRREIEAGLKLHRDQKAELVKAILANERNLFTEDELKVKDSVELGKLAAAMRVPDYSGRGGADVKTHEASGSSDIEILEAPTLDFGKKQ